MKRKELFSCRFAAGNRTYFFDVKVTREGVKYLTISESRPRGETHEHTRVMVFEENLEKFAHALSQAAAFCALESDRQHNELEPEGDRFEEIRQEHPKAYAKWTEEEDRKLEEQVKAGKSLTQLAAIFGRQPSAIRSRLSKLGLLPD